MTKRLATILSQISAATTATSTILSPKSQNPPTTTAPQPRAEAGPQRYTDGVGDPDCPFCHGLGYLREEVPPGHPNFGRLQPCVCQLDNMSVQQAEQLRRDSNTETLVGKTF